MNKIPVLHYMYMAGFVNDDGKWDSRPISQQEDNFKTFAELIVQECIAQCEKNSGHEYLGSGSKLSAFNIKQHFGIEE